MHQTSFILVIRGKYGVLHSQKAIFHFLMGTKKTSKLDSGYVIPYDKRTSYAKINFFFEWGQTRFGTKIAMAEVTTGSLNKILQILNFFFHDTKFHAK